MSEYRPSDADALALTDARANFTSLVDKAQYEHRPTDITRRGRLVARIVPPADAEERDAMCVHEGPQRHCGGDERIHWGAAKCCDCFDELDYWRHHHADVVAWLDEEWDIGGTHTGTGTVFTPRVDKVLRAAGDLSQIAMHGPFRGHPGISLYMTHLTAVLANLQDRQIAMYTHEAVRTGTSFNHLAIRTNRDTTELAARWTKWSWGQFSLRDRSDEEYAAHATVADDIGPGWRRLWDEGLARYRNAQLADVPTWQEILASRPHATANDD